MALELLEMDYKIKKMKKIIIFITILSLKLAQAQQGKIGINTENPEAALSVKSLSDSKNPKNLELENQNGDKLLTVLNSGNVGIGTASPAATLDIVGKMKITDGHQSAGRVLTSDSNGLASWEIPTMSYAYSTGSGVRNEIFPGSVIPANMDKYLYTGLKITLPSKGKYAVLLDLGISMNPNIAMDPVLNHTIPHKGSNYLAEGETVQVRGTFWDEILPDGIEKNPRTNIPMKNKANSMWMGAIHYPYNIIRASNTMYIENPTSGPKTYYFYAMANILNPKTQDTKYIYELGSGRWAEESLIAFKIGE